MPPQYEDDLFKESTMSFGQHLAELRVCLFRAVVGLALGVVVGLAVGKQVVAFINAPLERALERYYLKKAEKTIAEKYPDLSTELQAVVLNERKIFEDVSLEPGMLLENLRQAYPDQTLGLNLPQYQFAPADVRQPRSLAAAWEQAGAAEPETPQKRWWSKLNIKHQETVRALAHKADADVTDADRRAFVAALNELLTRNDLYDKATFADAAVPEDLVKRLTENQDAGAWPLLNWNLLATVERDLAKPHPHLVSLRLWREIKEVHWVRPTSISQTEAVMFWIKASFITGLVLASPWVFYQIWHFVASGLYPHERGYVYTYLPLSVGLFLAGVALTFGLVFDTVLDFLLSFNDWLGIEPSPRVADWMSFVLWMPLAFGISFQMPLVMLFLDRIGIANAKSYLKGWRLAILCIFIVSAILAPSPDPYTLLMLAMPLTVLYFGGIGLCLWGKKPKAKWD